MEGSKKGFSPSKAAASPKHSSTGENNENDSSQDQMIPKFQNHKEVGGKNFMSPTISAASKAVPPPRKKILADRNENSTPCDAQNHRKSNLDMKKSPRNSSSISCFDRSPSRVVSLQNNSCEPSDDEDTNFLADLPSNVYDPVKNYTSPRPKYLRFNPNRRREILDRLEKEGREDLISSFDSKEVNGEEGSSPQEIKNSCFSPAEESLVKPKNEGNTDEEDDNIGGDCEEEEEEEEEEVEEERGWCLKGILKLVLTLIACLFSTSYICSMNSPTPSPTQQAIWNMKEGYLMIKKQTLEVITMKMHDSGFLGVEVGDDYGEVEEVEIDVDDNGGTEESVDAEMVEDDLENSEGRDEEVAGNENVDSEDKVDKTGDFEFKPENLEQLTGEKTDESVHGGRFLLDSSEGVESSCSDLHEVNVDGVEAAETDIVVGGGDVEPKTDGFGQLVGAQTAESQDADELHKEVEASNQLQELELAVKSTPEEETQQEPKGVDGMESVDELVGSHEKLTDSGNEIGYDHEVEMERVGWNTSAVIGVSVASMILTPLALIYHSKKARNTSDEESEPVPKPHEFAAKEKTAPLPPPVQRKIEFFARHTASQAIEEAPAVLNSHHICAPTVELIGEIVVGQAESNATFSPKHGLLSQPAAGPTPPSALEYSTTNSHSYGSFATEKKMLKKEGGRSRDAMIEVTPVRRSSRLRNRTTVMSP
ncbi:hypothetical protein Salat_1496900 [Sesamum alatum]|uniref:Uncharacterized protein n=1 Tax=Sesamum alatum TaxID=300844 RepID=A0AAE2CM62_9LAMI|nr:hypothetical protein Salat_1496900 [Sesamum alatum]